MHMTSRAFSNVLICTTGRTCEQLFARSEPSSAEWCLVGALLKSSGRLVKHSDVPGYEPSGSNRPSPGALDSAVPSASTATSFLAGPLVAEDAGGFSVTGADILSPAFPRVCIAAAGAGARVADRCKQQKQPYEAEASAATPPMMRKAVSAPRKYMAVPPTRLPVLRPEGKK